ncbi:hypothetical protein [Tateyamaria sp. ANG-S1]|uniref:hypothetical protein n=1 Tax=Tateyamaria sp. ANG-S1 TaxID=1577905 RepID=UPI00068D55B4|nr:hypothetical protein [Tateyamaria sp. ANG-S1]
MSNEHRSATKPVNNKPFLLGYTVTPIGDGQKSVWSKIAAAWAHKDGEGYEVRMDALPVDGRLVLRTVKDDQQPNNEVVEPSTDGPA